MSRRPPSDRSGQNRRASDRRQRRSGEKGLSGEDARLWADVSKGWQPLEREPQSRPPEKPQSPQELPPKWRQAGGPPPTDKNTGASAGQAPGKSGGKSAGKSTTRHGKGGHETLPARRRQPEPGGFTRREMRQINSGRQPIEARLDLHGLRQAEAHTALRGFLARCQDQGLRHVLVITGKGRERNREEALFGEHEPGVLRRLAPMWLAEPGLRTLVAGYTEAPSKHGGEGALYVRLRRRRM